MHSASVIFIELSIWAGSIPCCLIDWTGLALCRKLLFIVIIVSVIFIIFTVTFIMNHHWSDSTPCCLTGWTEMATCMNLSPWLPILNCYHDLLSPSSMSSSSSGTGNTPCYWTGWTELATCMSLRTGGLGETRQSFYDDSEICR